MLKKTVCLFLVFLMSVSQCFAQVAVPLSLPSGLSGLSSQDRFRPCQLRSLIFDSRTQAFDLLFDKGDAKNASQPQVKETAGRLMEYFQVGLALPDSSFWVNLRPDKSSEVIDPSLEKTDLGRVLLEADVNLKKDLAMATSPDTAEGKKYWDRMYAKAEALFGRGQAVIPTVTRPWIVPGEIIVKKSAQSVYIYKATLKVKLEEDYLKGAPQQAFSDPRSKELNEYSSGLIRELIIPGLTKRVNSTRQYAPLRQAYYSLILAQWFKKHFRGSGAEFAGSIDSRDLQGLVSQQPWSKDSYVGAYRRSFSEGEYTVRRSVNNGTAVRTYSSGGFIMPAGILDGSAETAVSTVVPTGTDIPVPENVIRLDGRSLVPVPEKTPAPVPVKAPDDGGLVTTDTFISSVDLAMRMLDVKDYPRIAETYRRSVDPIAFVDNLSATSGKSVTQTLAALDAIPSFQTIAADYRVRSAKSFDPAEFSLKNISVGVSSAGYSVEGTFPNAAGQPISDLLALRRKLAGSVPFVFRDDMKSFVGSFLGMDVVPQKPDLRDLVDRTEGFLKSVELKKVKYVVTSGIGANEMYSHQLARLLNLVFKAAGVDFQWIVVNNPAHLNKIPADADNSNTIVFEMSRSGTTQETVDFFNATIARFTTRIVAANEKALKEAALNAKGNILVIDDTPGDIGGRQMNRKTLMVYLPLFIALAVGNKDKQDGIASARAQLKRYVKASYDSNEVLAYRRGFYSLGVRLAEFLFRHRAAGRNKLSVVFDESLRSTAKELFQLMNEGGNKNIAGGSNNNFLDFYSFQKNEKRYDTVFTKAPGSQLPLFLLNKNSAEYDSAIAYVEKLKQSGIPAIAITVDLSDTDLESGLESLARTSNLLQDMVVYFTYLTNQDANSNPAVKMVREITGAIFTIFQGKQPGDKYISIDEVIRQLDIEGESGKGKAKEAVDKYLKGNPLSGSEQKELQALKTDILTVATMLGLKDDALVAGTLVRSISSSVVKTDVGEAGGKKVAEIDEAFSRLGLDGLGALTDKPVDPAMSLTGQTILKGDPGFRVSAATNQKYTARKTDSLSRDMADYLYNLYRARKETFRYLALTYAEADADNPRIEEIAQDLTGRFSDLDISVPMLALPGVAHTGIEAVMSHPESFFNIAIVYTDTYGDSFNGLGRQEVVKGVSVDTRTYGYAVGNIHRASLAGIPTILFELKDKERLPEAQAIISDAMRMFRERIDKGDGGDGNDKKTAPASAKDTPGGVAFQDLAATELAAASPATGKGTVRVSARELDAQWKEIRLELVKGNAPYPEIKKFVAACSGRDDARLRLKAAVTCIDEILKKQAEECVPSEGALVEILRQLG